MKRKRGLALFLCMAMIVSSLAGCRAPKVEQAKSDVNVEVVDEKQAAEATSEKEKPAPISDAVNTEDDSAVNYDTNIVSGADVQKNTDEKEDEKADESTQDVISSLIEENKKEDPSEEEGFVAEKEPEENIDSEGNLEVPFDIAYPDVFNSDDVEFADNAILVKVADGYSEETVEGLKNAKVGKMEVMFDIDAYTWYVAYLLKGTDITEAMELVREVPGVAVAEYNYKYETAATSAEAVEAEISQNSRYNEQWPMDHFGIREGWEKYYEKNQTGGGSSSVIVAVIDTGVDYTHPDLKSNMWVNMDEIPDNYFDDDGNGYVDDYYGIDMTARQGSGMDDNGHGTHVAGIVAATNNTEGVVGYAYNTKIMSVKAGDASGYFLQNNIAEAILYAYTEGADVINMSFGGVASSIAVQDALEVAYARCVLVASAGNDGMYNEGPMSLPNYPAAFSYVLGVMSVGSTMVESSFTNYDVWLYTNTEYEVYAPGEQILSTLPGGRYGYLSGTSMASPVVAAQAALLRSFYSDASMYPTKFIYGQIVGTATPDVQCLNPEAHGVHNIPGVVNFHDSLTELPVPELGMSDYTLFDSVEFIADKAGIASESKNVNNGDGIVDSGEVIALGFTLRNRWGMAENVKVHVDTKNSMGGEANYVTFLNNDISYGPVGTYSENDSGKIFDESSDGRRWIGWENPFYLKIDPKCPNDYSVTIYLTITCENGLNPEDTAVYTTEEKLVLKIRRGTELPNRISEDMTLTKDNYYIIPNSMLIMKGATLTVEAGTQIQFWCSDPEDAYADSAITYLQVDGSLICNGTEEEPVEIFPSGWMDSYVVEINKSGMDSYIEMNYTNVVNPYISIDKAVGCEFTQNYRTNLNDRVLSNGQVSQTWQNTSINIGEAIDCAFYKIGGEWSSAHLYGDYERCIFVDSNIQYYITAENCVFYGNNNELGDGQGGTSSITMSGISSMNVSSVFRNPDTGSTYMVLSGGVSMQSMLRFIKMMGGQVAVFDTKEELLYVADKLPTNDSYSSYACGLYTENDILYNHDGTPVDWKDSIFKVEPYETSKRLIHNNSTYFYVDYEMYQNNVLVEIPGDIYITNIELDQYVVDLDLESSHIIDAVVSPATADSSTLLYTSENEAVAVVDENGKITPVAPGTTQIRVYAPDYAIYNYVTVNVVDAVPLEGLSLTEAEFTMAIQAEKKLNVKFTPVHTTKRELKFASSDEAVATVNEKGVVKAVGEGSATITITGDGGIVTMATVHVVIPAKNLAFATDTYATTISAEDGTAFYPVITPEDTTDQTLIWESSNPEICEIDENGQLIKHKAGRATLRATLKGTQLSDTIIILITEEVVYTQIVKMSSRSDYSSSRLALTSDGVLWQWGEKSDLALPSKVEVNGVGFIKDYAYGSYYYFLSESGDVHKCYETNGILYSNSVILSGIKAFSYGNTSSVFAIDENGGVWAWGGNDYGQLGNGTTTYISSPVGVAFPQGVSIKKIVSSDYGALFLAENGDVYVTGAGKYFVPEKIESGIQDIYEMSGLYQGLDNGYSVSRLAIYSNFIERYYEGQNKTVDEEIILISHSLSYYIEDGKVYKRIFNSENPDKISELPMSDDGTAEKLFFVNDNLYVQSAEGGVYAYGKGSGYELGNGTNEDSNDLKRIYFVESETASLVLESVNLKTNEDNGCELNEPSLVMNFNQEIFVGSNYASIELRDSLGKSILLTTTLNLDKLVLAPRAGFVDGETYTLSIPNNAVIALGGYKNESMNYSFTYHEPEDSVDEGTDDDTSVLPEEVPEEEKIIHDAVIDSELMDQRHIWTKDEVMDLWNAYVADGYDTTIYSSAILNRLNDDNTSMWLRFTAESGSGAYGTAVGLGGNYWGTTDDFLINKQILDFDDYQSLLDINEGAILMEAPEDTFPFVVNAYLEVDGEKVDTVGNDIVTFVVEFNRDMDTSIDLEVCFGSSYPHREYTVSGAYESARVWKGEMKLSMMIENGYQYWSVSNGKAADTSLKLYEDWGRFPFKIDTSSAQALTMQAEPTANGIHLTWQQDDFETLAGYNVYRATIEDGQYTRINTTVIPADTKEWLDTGVEPGQKYYYNFTVVESDLTESEPSGKVEVTAWDTMAPDIYHSPIYQAFAGNKLMITATVTDNVGIKAATVYYRVTGTDTWMSVEMSNNNDKYSAVIPAEYVTEAGVEYYIEATDGVTKTYKGSAESPYSITIQIPVADSEKGDVDGNGLVELKDALMVLMAINDRLNLTQTEFTRADLDGNGELAAYEALRIIQYVNGTLTNLLP